MALSLTSSSETPMAPTGRCLCGIGGSWEDESVILPCLKAPEHRHFRHAIGGWEDENANRRKNENGRCKLRDTIRQQPRLKLQIREAYHGPCATDAQAWGTS